MEWNECGKDGDMEWLVNDICKELRASPCATRGKDKEPNVCYFWL